MYGIKYRKPEEMKDSGVEWIGLMPICWNLKKIKYVTTSIKNGIWGEDPKDNTNDIPCIRVANFNRNEHCVDLNDLTIRNLNKYKQKSYLLKRNDLLIEKSGGGENQPVGFVCIYNSNISAIYANFIAKISVENGNSNQYVSYYFTSMYNKRINTKHINQTTGIQNINTTSYFNEKIAIPMPDEQQKIANYLDIKTDHFDSIISKKELLIQKLEEAKKSLISEVVTGKVKIVDGKLVKRQPEEMKESKTIYGKIPFEWNCSKIKFALSVNARIGWKGLKANEYVEKGYFLLSTPNIKGREIDFDNVNYIDEKRFNESPDIKLKEGDILLTKDGSTLGTVNVIRKLESEGTVNSSIAILRSKRKINPIYVYYLLMSDPMVWKINMMKDGMGVPHLFQSDIKELDILIPSNNEMVLISQYLDLKTEKLEELIIKAGIQIQKLKEAKQSLISEAVTGKIDLRDWEIIEEGELQ